MPGKITFQQDGFSSTDSFIIFHENQRFFIKTKVIVTNCSAARHELQVLVEIPSGSIPVTTNDYTKTHNIILDPFSTKPIEYYFYFPSVLIIFLSSF